MDNLNQLKSLIKQWSIELGFDDIGVSDINIQEDEHHLNEWLKNNYHGSMFYMEKHGKKHGNMENQKKGVKMKKNMDKHGRNMESASVKA